MALVWVNQRKSSWGAGKAAKPRGILRSLSSSITGGDGSAGGGGRETTPAPAPSQYTHCHMRDIPVFRKTAFESHSANADGMAMRHCDACPSLP